MIERVRPERVAELSHQRRRADAAARHVAHREVHEAVLPVHDVVPVAADLETRRAGVVPRRHLEAGDHRQPFGQQAPLQPDGSVVIPLAFARALDGHRSLPGLRHDQRLVGVVQDSLVAE